MRSLAITASAALGLFVAGSAWADPPAASPAPVAAPPPVAPATPATPADKAGPRPAEGASDETQERSANNAVYVEGLGSALFYSINYDRTFGDFSGRIGFGYLSVSATAGNGTSTGASASASFVAVPITVSYLGIGSKKHMLELGAGATIFHVGAGASGFNTDAKASATEGATFALPTALVGYRLQPPDGGFFLRTGIAPIFAGSSLPVLPWPYLALGGTF